MKKQIKTKLSRILCTALTLCMIISLIPAAFAATTEEATEFSIDFKNNGTNPGITNTEYGERNWAYFTNTADSNVEYKGGSYGIVIKARAAGEYYAIKVKAPATGYYRIAYTYYQAKTGTTEPYYPNGGKGKVSFIDYSETTASNDIDTAVSGTTADLFAGIEYGIAAESGVSKTTTENPIRYLEKDEEYLVIISSTDGMNNGNGDTFRMYATSFTFTPYDIENAVYSFAKADYSATTDPSHITYENSAGRVEFHSITAAPEKYMSLWNGDYACFDLEGGYVAYKLNIPAAGTYKAMLDYKTYSNSDKAADFYILPMADVVSTDGKTPVFEDVSIYAETTASATATGTFTTDTAGEHLLVMRDSMLGFVRLSKITLSNNPALSGAGTVYTINTTERLNVGDEADVAVTAYDAVTGIGSSYSGAAITSSDSSIVSVNNGKITANKTGVATLSATINGFKATCEVAVVGNTAKNEAESISFGVYSDAANSVTVSGVGGYAVNSVGGADSGTEITVTAQPNVDGRVFRGWKRGSEDNGVYISDEESLTLKLTSNTFLTAVYDTAAADAATVEFYNYNGQFITSEEVDDKAFSALKPADEPSLTGYSFGGWTLDGKNTVDDTTVFEKLTRVMAKYTKETTKYRISVVGYLQSITDATPSGNYAYDTELTFTSKTGNAGTWTVNGKPAAYGSTYTHIVWDDAEINFIEKTYDGPILSIDKAAKAKGARVISYDANGADIIEVGILFGDGASLGSFSGKAASKEKGNVKGQFTATPNSGTDATARGYLIYDDNGTKKVIYAD